MIEPVHSPASPRDWLERVADPQSARSIDPALDVPRPSPYLARWSIAPQANDGIETAEIAMGGRRLLAVAQDRRFLGGAVGAEHARVLQRVLDAARARAMPVLLLLASGGVRLHEANPAEVALARALRALVDARAAGVSVIALAIGDVFGGTSVLACAAERLGMLPGTRLGLSGPKVIATARGKGELDPADRAAIDALFGASARSHSGDADLVAADTISIRAWIAQALAVHTPFDRALREDHARLRSRLETGGATARDVGYLPESWRAASTIVDPNAGLWRTRDDRAWIVAATGDDVVSARRLHAVDEALLERVLDARTAPRAIVLVEDSRGHEVSRCAEAMCLSRYLAHHACVIGLMRENGIVVRALLSGQGHSAAFFANALQADRVIASEHARVMAMNPEAVARVTGLDRDALRAHIDDDAVIGHDVRLFAQWGGVAAVVAQVDESTLNTMLSDSH